METFDADIEGVRTQRHKRLDILHGRLLVRESKDSSELGVLINQDKHVRLVAPGLLGHGQQVQ